MSEASAGGSSISVPQPPAKPEALRAVLAQIAPAALAAFDAERTQALREAREQLDAEPMRRFTAQWADRVALERHPEQAARLDELIHRAEAATDLADARRYLAEIAEIQRRVHAEAQQPSA